MLLDRFHDRKLNIKTTKRDYSKLSSRNYGYDPTPYAALFRLAESGYIKSSDIVVDYGCGKGRAGFVLNHELGCRVVGVDINRDLIRDAKKNRSFYGDDGRIKFVCSDAIDYTPRRADVAFFFNPFTGDVLKKVLDNLRAGTVTEDHPLRLVFFYPTGEYTDVLSETENILFRGVVDGRDVRHRDGELFRILIFDMY